MLYRYCIVSNKKPKYCIEIVSNEKRNVSLKGGHEGWSTWHRPGLLYFLEVRQSNFSANWPPVLFSLTISPVTVVLLGVGIKLCFSGGCPIIRYAHNSDLDECQVWRLPRVQIWFQHLTIDQCKVWCMLKRGYTTSPVTGGPSVARFHVNGGHPQPHTPRFSDIERV